MLIYRASKNDSVNFCLIHSYTIYIGTKTSYHNLVGHSRNRYDAQV